MLSKLYLATTLALSLGLTSCARPDYLWRGCDDRANLYNMNFTVQNAWENETIRMEAYKGQVLMIVNVASYWSFTYQYYALNDLIEKSKGKKFSVLGFPCNQFAYQEPAANATELYNGMAWVRPGMQKGYNYVPFFPLTKKLDVNGKDQEPIFKYLKYACPPPREEFSETSKLFYEPLHGTDIRWNFEKFLITKDGRPFRRYTSATLPAKMENDIRHLLGEIDIPPTQSGDAFLVEY